MITFQDCSKRSLLEHLLHACPFVYVDTAWPRLTIPDHLRVERSVVFRVGEDPRVLGIPDLVIDAAGWRASLSFGGTLFYAVVPWGACFAFSTGEPNQEPEVTIRFKHVQAPSQGTVPAPVDESRKTQPFLRLVR